VGDRNMCIPRAAQSDTLTVDSMDVSQHDSTQQLAVHFRVVAHLVLIQN